MTTDNKKKNNLKKETAHKKVKFEIFGDEMIEKVVNSSGNSGRIYLPPEWIGTKVKVVKC